MKHFIWMAYLYHGDLYSDLWKSDLHFRPAILAVHRYSFVAVLCSLVMNHLFKWSVEVET